MVHILTNKGESIEWRIGDLLDVNLTKEVPECTSSVAADGDELYHIKRHVCGVPNSDAGIQRWFGDDAKFIVHYLFVEHGE